MLFFTQGKVNWKYILIIVLLLLVITGLFIFWPKQKQKEEKQDLESQVQSIVAKFDLNEPRSFYSVSEVAELGEEIIPDLKEMAESDSLYDQWTAVITLSTLLRKNPELKGKIIPTLEQGLKNKNSTLRMLSAAQLLSFGEKRGVPILISNLGSEEITIFSDPPHLIAEQSNLYLKHFTGQDFGFDYNKLENGREEVIQDWQQWWSENKEVLLWNEDKGIFEISD